MRERDGGRRGFGSWWGAFGLGLVVVAGIAVSVARSQSARSADRVTRGRYLVESVGACGSCHTPRSGAEEDRTKLLSGHPANAPSPKFSMEMMQQGIFISINPTYTAFAGPWGVSYATNLTPDKETGLGKWTEEKFVLAMRTGLHLGDPKGRPVLPPMPWKHYQSATDDDLRSMWSYLQTVPAVRNAVPQALNRLGKPY